MQMSWSARGMGGNEFGVNGENLECTIQGVKRNHGHSGMPSSNDDNFLQMYPPSCKI